MKYCKEYVKQLILAPLFKLLEACFDLSIPYLMTQVIDIGIKNGDVPFIIKNIIIIIIFGIVGFGCTIIAQYYSASASIGITGKIKQTLFSHIQSLSLQETDQFSNATLLSRLTSDTAQIQMCLNLSLRLLLRAPIIVFGSLVMAFLISKKIALIFLITIVILLTIVTIITLISVPLYQSIQGKQDSLVNSLKDNLTGVRILRAFNKQKAEINEFEGLTTNLQKGQNKIGIISGLLNPLTYSLVNIAIVLIIYYGAINVDLGLLTSGQVIALYNYMSQILVELVKLVNLIIVITKAFASYRRIDEILHMDSSLAIVQQQPETKDSEALIEFKNVNFQYPTASEEVLQDISFTVTKGQNVGIIGPTGSGKSSIINLLLRYYDANTGVININGVDIKDYPLTTLRDLFSYVPQKVALFSGSIASNLLMANSLATEKEMWKALKLARIEYLADGSLDKQILQKGLNLSGGQKQRLAIAQAFVRHSQILLLDDSTSALDFKTESYIRKTIKQKHYTSIIVSQRVSNIMNCDTILVLQDGKIIGNGNHLELLETCPFYREIYKTQIASEDRL